MRNIEVRKPNPSYAEKRRDPRWQKKTRDIFERDGWTCLQCGSKVKTFHPHHVLYVLGRDPWDYPDYLIQTLCEDCHEIRQEITDNIANAVKLAIKDVPTERLLVCAQKICAAAMITIDASMYHPEDRDEA